MCQCAKQCGRDGALCGVVIIRGTEKRRALLMRISILRLSKFNVLQATRAVHFIHSFKLYDLMKMMVGIHFRSTQTSIRNAATANRRKIGH